MATTVYLARLGQTEANSEGKLTNFSKLSSTGKEQVDKLCSRLTGISFDTIISSSLGPARETADIIGKHMGLPTAEMKEFDEVDWGKWDGLSKPQIINEWPAEWELFLSGSLSIAPSAEESLEKAKDRMEAGLLNVCDKYPGGTVCIVSHGASSRLLIANLLQSPLSSFPKLPNINTSLTVFDFDPQKGAVFKMIADGCHLSSNEPSGLLVTQSVK